MLENRDNQLDNGEQAHHTFFGLIESYKLNYKKSKPHLIFSHKSLQGLNS